MEMKYCKQMLYCRNRIFVSCNKMGAKVKWYAKQDEEEGLY